MGSAFQHHIGACNAARSHAALTSAFELLAESAARMERCDPPGGKNVKYYVAHFGRVKTMKHRLWFARELYTYAVSLEYTLSPVEPTPASDGPRGDEIA
ncbi:MAG: hypothetical protein V3V08_23195 [Nannocystaceae bacterium]